MHNTIMQQNLSSNTLRDIHRTVCKQYVMQFGVNIGREELAAWLRGKMDFHGWSTHEVSRRGKAAGYTLSNGTVSNILNVTIANVRDETLRALAAAFKVPETEILAIYSGRPAPGEMAETTRRAVNLFEALPEETQDDALTFLEMLFQKHAVAGDGRGAELQSTKESQASDKAGKGKKKRA